MELSAPPPRNSKSHRCAARGGGSGMLVLGKAVREGQFATGLTLITLTFVNKGCPGMLREPFVKLRRGCENQWNPYVWSSKSTISLYLQWFGRFSASNERGPARIRGRALFHTANSRGARIDCLASYIIQHPKQSRGGGY